MLPTGIKTWLAKKAVSALGLAFIRGDDVTGRSQNGSLSEPYRRSAWVRSAIEKIAGPVASVEVEFYGTPASRQDAKTPRRKERSRKRSGRAVRLDAEQEVENPVLMDFLREPMKGMTWSDFVEASVGWLRLAGEVFWIIPDDALVPFPGAAGGNRKVIVARPDRMRHVVHAGVLEGWVFTDGSGRQITLTPEQVIQLKNWNPYNEWRGLGQFEAAAMAAESDFLAGRFARNLMANNGDTGPYVVVKSGAPSPDQKEQLLADLRAKRAAQLRGDFKPMVLGGDVSIEDPKVRTVDASYIAGRIENRHEIYVALGVPPSMADVKAAYSIGSASDWYQLITGTCMPAGDKLCDGLDGLSAIFTGMRLSAYLDWDEHPVMQEVRKERLNSVDSLWSKGMPLALISDYLSLGLPEFDGDQIGYLPFSVAPVSEPAKTEDNPDLQEPPQDVEAIVGDAIRELTGFKPRVATDPCSCGCSLEDIAVKDRDPKEVAQWKEIVSARLPIIKAFRTKFDQVLMKARRTVLAKIEAKKSIGHAGERVPTRAAAADFMFSLADFGAELTASMRATSIQAVKAAGNQVFKELAKDDPWQMPSAETLKFLGDRENKLTNVPDEIFSRVKETIQEQIEKGGTMDEIAAAVKAEFNKISDARGRTIAQTETSAAYGFGRQKALEDAGIKYKRWLTSGNSNVRMAHRIMNGAVVAVAEKFMVIDPDTGSSDYVMGPGDTDGAAWNVINCHCVSVASAEGPAEVEPAE